MDNPALIYSFKLECKILTMELNIVGPFFGICFLYKPVHGPPIPIMGKY